MTCEKRNTLYTTAFFTMVGAILLGVYAQSIADLFVDDWYMALLTAITIISMGLFVVTVVIQFLVLISDTIQSRISSTLLTLVLFISVAIGLIVSWWSFFVLAMSWG